MIFFERELGYRKEGYVLYHADDLPLSSTDVYEVPDHVSFKYCVLSAPFTLITLHLLT